jgi:iduronate 2-sulfatase
MDRMRRRDFLRNVGFGLAGASTFSSRPGEQKSQAASAAQRPNILFIACDDLRPELGCYGNPVIKTPAMDRLAASGVRFTRSFCQSSVCNPSRVSLLTGLRPDSIKVWDLLVHFRETMPDVVTLPQHFRQHGYRAMAFGKIFHHSVPDRRSWDVPTYWPRYSTPYSQATLDRIKVMEERARAKGWNETLIRNQVRGPAIEVDDVPDNRRWDGELAEQAMLSLVGLARAKKPFFLAVGFFSPHLPFVAPKKYWDLYDPARIPGAPNSSLPKGMPPIAMNILTELRVYSDFTGAPKPSSGPLTEAQRRALKHGYYASVSFVDAQIGRLLRLVDRLGIAGSTIVVLWGDNGWKLGEHGSWCKTTNYESDTLCPLIIRAPGRSTSGRACGGLVEFLDIYPTLCQLAGLPLPAHLQGHGLAGLIDDPAGPARDAAFSQLYRLIGGRHVMSYAMRTDRHRFIEWRDWEKGEVIAEELYDHSTDPGENVNIAGQPDQAEILRRLRDRMRRTCPVQTGHGTALVRARRSEIVAVLEIISQLGEEAFVYELDASGARQDPKTIKAGGRLSIDTFVTHPFVVESKSGEFYRLLYPESPRSEVILRKPSKR